MRYILLIYTDQAAGQRMSEAEIESEMAAYYAFTERVRPKMQAGEALMPTTTATTVRVRDGKTLTTDGPYAETKEQLGGFYLLDCADLDEAIALAAQIPGATHGSIEIRPIAEFDTAS